MKDSTDARARAAPSSPLDPDRRGRSRVREWVVPMLLFALIGGLWASNTGGLVSSNDGSHLALTRALGLYGQADIDEEAALTLRVDLAQRDGHYYSDRPPGTAFLAVPAVALGHRWDGDLLKRSRAKNEMVIRPASEPFARTYYKRWRRAPFLILMMGSILGASLHAVVIGLIGLAFSWVLLARRGCSIAGRVFAISTLAFASLWGPYSTVLFSHGTAAALIAGYLLGLDALRSSGRAGRRASARELWILGALTGLAGAWAVACDYLLLTAVVPLALLSVEWRRWPALLPGALPITVAVLVYHQIAFGSPWSIGYDHHVNFEFARTRAATFDGDLVGGMATLWGTRQGAGLLSMAPIVFVGLLASPVALAASSIGRRSQAPTRAADAIVDRRHRALQLLAWAPWVLILAIHHTPSGGQGVDHRYLVPMFPMAALGLGDLWMRAGRRGGSVTRWTLRVCLVALGLWSALQIWPHFFAWHEGRPFENPGVGLAVAGGLLAAFLLPRIVAYAFGGDERPEADRTTN